jgi:hypothetical protein
MYPFYNGATRHDMTRLPSREWLGVNATFHPVLQGGRGRSPGPAEVAHQAVGAHLVSTQTALR